MFWREYFYAYMNFEAYLRARLNTYVRDKKKTYLSGTVSWCRCALKKRNKHTRQNRKSKNYSSYMRKNVIPLFVYDYHLPSFPRQRTTFTTKKHLINSYFAIMRYIKLEHLS